MICPHDLVISQVLHLYCEVISPRLKDNSPVHSPGWPRAHTLGGGAYVGEVGQWDRPLKDTLEPDLLLLPPPPPPTAMELLTVNIHGPPLQIFSLGDKRILK